jgi:hypothetical protein
MLGYFIIALFALSWIVSVAIYRWRQLEFLHIPSSGSRLNQLGRAEFEVKGIEQRGLLRHFFAQQCN